MHLKTKQMTHYLRQRGLCFAAIEQVLMRKTFSSDKPIFLIFGLPRSGTTLIYQYIVHRLHVSYFTNSVGKFPYSPCVITYLQHKLCGDYKSDFQSNYGKVRGKAAPREAGSFWGRAFGFDDYIKFSDVSQRDVNLLRHTVACVQSLFGNLSFVNKNVKHILRIDALKRIFPSFIFVVVNRDICDVALSVIRGRYKQLTNPHEWWSAKPSNYQSIKDLSIHEQVAHQLISLKGKMLDDLSIIGSKSILSVNYADFCNDPESLIKQVLNLDISLRFKNQPVERFKPQYLQPQNEEERQLLEVVALESKKQNSRVRAGCPASLS